MKIKSKNNTVSSCKLIVPIDGLITIDVNGFADVSESCADVLVANTNDWIYADNSKDDKSVSDKKNSENNSEENDSDKERELLIEKLKSSKIGELKDMCSEANFNKEEWTSMSKKALEQYLLNKYDESSDEEDDD